MAIDSTGRAISLGVIGLGGRGQAQLGVLLQMQDVEVKAVCDVYEDRVAEAKSLCVRAGRSEPEGCHDAARVFERQDIEAVIIMTGWQTHIQLAAQALRAGKPAGIEVGGASSVEECWQLVRTAEETGLGVMLLENCCYGREEMTLLRMVREGVFGEVVHCQGGYQHDLRDEIGLGDINRHYRQDHFRTRNGELYPTHELGPIAGYLDLNRGNRMLSLVSMASKAAGQAAWMREHRPEKAGENYLEGDIVTTMIKCARGETILLMHDCTLPRAYSRGGRVQGTKGLWMEDNRCVYLEGRSPYDPSDWMHHWESDAKYMEEYLHPLWREYEQLGPRGGHGGMDYLVLRAFVESLQEKKPFPIDVYDAAAWMAVTALSEESIALGSAPVAVPDFTGGRWMRRGREHLGQYEL